MADVVDIPEFRAFYYTDDTPRSFIPSGDTRMRAGLGKCTVIILRQVFNCLLMI